MKKILLLCLGLFTFSTIAAPNPLECSLVDVLFTSSTGMEIDGWTSEEEELPFITGDFNVSYNTNNLDSMAEAMVKFENAALSFSDTADRIYTNYLQDKNLKNFIADAIKKFEALKLALVVNAGRRSNYQFTVALESFHEAAMIIFKDMQNLYVQECM